MSTPLRERPDAPLGTLIFRAGLLPAETIENALEEGVKTGKRLGEILTERGLISEVDLARLLAGQKGLEFVTLREQIVDPSAASLFTGEQARLFRALPYAFDGEFPVVAIADPTDEVLMRNIREALGRDDARFVVSARGELADIATDVYSKPLTPVPEAQPEPVEEPEPFAEAEPEPVAEAEPDLPAPAQHTNGSAPAEADLILQAPAYEPAPAPETAPVAEPEPVPVAFQVPVVDEPVAHEPIRVPEPEPVAAYEPPPVPEPMLSPEPEPVAEPEASEAYESPAAPEPPALQEPVVALEAVVLPEPPLPAEPSAAPEPLHVSEPPTMPEPTSPPESVAAPEPVASAEPVPFPQPAPAPAPAPYPPAASLPESEPEPEPVTEQPELSLEPVAESTGIWRMTIRLTNGERVEGGDFPDQAGAKQEAKAIMSQIADADQDEWPFVNGRFLKPDTIVSVDIAEHPGNAA